MNIVKQLAIIFGFFLLALFLNSLFQTACQEWWGTVVNNQVRCRLTESLNGTVYMIIILIITAALYISYLRWRNRKERSKLSQ